MAYDPSQMFAQAVSEFQNGHLNRAADLCQEIITKAAPNAICLHLMGVIHHKQGKSAEAEQWIRKSLALQPNVAEVNFNLGLALLAQHKYTDAIEFFQKSVGLNPSYAPGYFQIGNAYKDLQQYDKAISAYKQSLVYNPNNEEAMNSLGVVLSKQGHLEDAIGYFSRALVVRTDFPEALNNMGVAYLELDRPEQTRELCEKAISIRPNYTAALNNLGNAFKTQGSFTQAIEYYERALTIDPGLTEARNNLGLSMMYGMSAIDSAIACFEEILKYNPTHPQALNNLGITLCHQGLHAEGMVYYQKALESKPDYVDALSNLACALRAIGKTDEALSLYEQVVAKKPNFPEAHNNFAMLLLSVGRFSEGFREYEWRWKTSQLKDAYRTFTQPQWKGEDIKERTLLIHAEQGFGDTLQFCRLADIASKRGIHVLMEVPQPLARLMRSLKGPDKIIVLGDTLPAFDYHCPMLSLPQALNLQLETIPTQIPYLFAEKLDLETWQKRIPKIEGIQKIGLVWAGNPRLHSFDLATIDRQRSMPVEQLAPLMHIPNKQFYSLQKDSNHIPSEFPIIDLMSDCHDFADTAALIMQLDLIISVDTSVVHLAGALGKPVWLLNRHDSCWRWLNNYDESPWYPELRQFRQTKHGDWTTVIQRISDALCNSK